MLESAKLNYFKKKNVHDIKLKIEKKNISTNKEQKITLNLMRQNVFLW